MLDRTACGSSSGSAAAVAAGLAAAAIGTETDGSVTCPSAVNGVVGLKPTVGLVSRAGIVPISHTQDTAGPITRTVRDAAMLLTAMAGSDPADPATADANAHRAHYESYTSNPSGSKLDKSSIQNATEALNQVPGVSGYNAGQTNGTVLTVRGVTAAGSMFSGPSPIGYYLDYVPFGLTRDAIEPNPNIYDLNRIEVLRGPQGTLYGASALNGVVNVLTNDANLDELEVKGRAGLSMTDGGGANWVGDGAINIPVIPGALAARLVVGSQHNSGWINTPLRTHVNHADSENVRLKVTAKASDDLTIKLEAMHQGSTTGAPPNAAPDGFSASLIDQSNKSDWNYYNVHVDYTPQSVFTLLSSTSYFTFYDNGAVDAAIGVPGIPPLTTRTLSRVMSEELDLLSNIQGPWRWSAGFFYRNARDSNYQTLGNLIPAPVSEADTSVSYAVFGEVGRFFLDRQLELSVGGRYFHDNVGLRQLQLFGQPRARH